jgi:hypothetical protein
VDLWQLQLSWISTQLIVNIGCCDGRVAECHTQLMQIRDDVPRSVKTLDCSALMVVDKKIAILGASSA